jgi:SAM-dependent methyltransferase
MTAKDRDYLLGTHDAEIERLGLQHRVWRPRVLDAWKRAGITVGSRVVDAGAGPGWATLDLAEIVGPGGHVHALERSERYIEHIEATAQARGFANIATANLDLVTDRLPVLGADAFWIRWVLAFVSDAPKVVQKLADTLKPGGVAIIHEYLDYATWSMAPRTQGIEAFKEFVIADWRKSGGEPDIARKLPEILPAAGLKIREMRPIIDVINPGNFIWQWPKAFVTTYPEHLVATGKMDQAWADRLAAEFEAADADPASVMVTPLVLEVIAEKI